MSMLSFYLSVLDDPGDSDKFEALYIKYRAKMIRVAYGVLRDAADAEDAVHNAFLSIANNIEKIGDTDGCAAMGYVCRAAKNAAINLYNKRNRKNEKEVHFPYEDFLGAEDDALNGVCSKESLERIVNAIRSLPDAYRDALYLYYVEEQNADKIAKSLGLKKATAKKRLVRGRKLLIETLGGGRTP